MEIDVNVSIVDAFRIFTERFDAIKPREHNIKSVDIAETILELWPGGRLVDIGIDGTTFQWDAALESELRSGH